MTQYPEPQRSPTEVLIETCVYYATNPENRVAKTTSGLCMMITESGARCAASRLCRDEIAKSYLADIKGRWNTLLGVVASKGLTRNQILKPENWSLSDQFISDLQLLHDETHHWNFIEGGVNDSFWGSLATFCTNHRLNFELISDVINVTLMATLPEEASS